VFTEKHYPTFWATTQSNLGNAYKDLPDGDRTANFQKAIDRAGRIRKDLPTRTKVQADRLFSVSVWIKGFPERWIIILRAVYPWKKRRDTLSTD
jgi:hypothetical protein